LVAGLPAVLVGILVAVGPRTLFPVCEGLDDPSMPCHWTALVEAGVGGVLALLGVALILCARGGAESCAPGLHVAVFLDAALALLVPTALVGVCQGAHMPCRLLTLPALAVLGSLLMLASAMQGWRAFAGVRRGRG
jgi:hypothetical protein